MERTPGSGKWGVNILMKIQKWWKKINYVGPGDAWSIGPLSIIEKWMVKIIYIMLPIFAFFLIMTILLGEFKR